MRLPFVTVVSSSTSLVKRGLENMCSSVASVSSGTDTESKVFTEADWSVLDDPRHEVSAYPKSKTLAERAAWEYVASLDPASRFELATILPGFVQGPVLGGTQCTSSEPISRLLQRSMPMVPDVNFSIVDVRDVAKAHILAMTAPAAASERFLAVSGNVNFHHDIAAILKREGYNVPTMQAPNFIIRMGAWFDPALKSIAGSLSKATHFSNEKAKAVLGMEFIPPATSIIDMARSLSAAAGPHK